MKKLAEITPLLFEDHLIISIKKDWIDVWGQIPKFSVAVGKDSQLIIKSKPVDVKRSGGSVSE